MGECSAHALGPVYLCRAPLSPIFRFPVRGQRYFVYSRPWPRVAVHRINSVQHGACDTRGTHAREGLVQCLGTFTHCRTRRRGPRGSAPLEPMVMHTWPSVASPW